MRRSVTNRQVILAARTALPYPHLERATAGLRCDLHLQLVAASSVDWPHWDAGEVTGPVETTDARERMWFEYRASLETGTDDAPAMRSS